MNKIGLSNIKETIKGVALALGISLFSGVAGFCIAINAVSIAMK